MEKYSGIHNDHRYENKLTRAVSTFCFIAHCNWSVPADNFSGFSYLNIWIQEVKYSNIQMVQRSNIQIIQLEIQIFWYCTLTKFMLIPNLDKLTTQFDFDNALLSKIKNINDFSIGWYIRDIFSECMLKANVCFLGIIISAHSCLVGFDVYTNDFHSLNLSQ